MITHLLDKLLYNFKRLKNKPPSCIVVLLFIAIFIFSGSGWCIEISDEPLDTNTNPAPSNLMFILDNSGSMDWEFITTESSGVFDGNYYLFPYSDYSNGNEHTFGPSSTLGKTLSEAERAEWKSQLNSYNRMYYDPQVIYLPWPDTVSNSFSDADVTTPLANPVGDTTFNLFNDFVIIPGTVNYGQAVIIDNIDGSPGFSTTGAWRTTGDVNVLGGNHEVSEGSGHHSATWSTDLPDGNYAVMVRWDRDSRRLSNVNYSITSIDGTENIEINQQNSSLDIYPTDSNDPYRDYAQLGGAEATYHLAGVATVSINNTTSRNSQLSADAVVFVPVTINALVVSNAHYYVHLDDDNDGEYDNGEIYLVTFTDSDDDDIIDVVGSGFDDKRKYYQINENDTDGQVEIGEFVEVIDPDLINRIRTEILDENGNPFASRKFVTDTDDLQNFANWFSYFRKRELTAKSAVATTISTIDNMQVGLYTINDNNGARQTVVPVNVDMSKTIIVGTESSSFYTTGNWEISTEENSFGEGALYTTNAGDSATWIPEITITDEYDVYAWWDCYRNRDEKAVYTIEHSGGTNVVVKNQRFGQGADGCGEWVLLGSYTFDEGMSGRVTVERVAGTATGSSTVANAIKFQANSNDSDVLLDYVYSISSNYSTPLREALQNVGMYYDADDGKTGEDLGEAPFLSEEDGGQCQQCFTIAMTDGYWNGDSPGVGNVDGLEGAPFADTYSDTLADVAMYYYNTDLHDTLDNNVPTSETDSSSEQHMVTYSLSFGVSGNRDSEVDDPYNPTAAQDPFWLDPGSSEPAKIDDLWHAAVNSRGLYFNASSSSELADSMNKMLGSVTAEPSGASVAVAGGEIKNGSVIYQARYVTGDWTGTVRALKIIVEDENGDVVENCDVVEDCEVVTGNLATEIDWDASDVLQDLYGPENPANSDIFANNRKVLTYNGTDSGKIFEFANLTAEQKVLLDPDAAVASNIVRFIRGDNDISGSGFRTRGKILGDIVNSAPVFVKDLNMVLAGANDGMLHAFDADDGSELFSYVPNLVYSTLKDLTATDYKSNHRFYVDSTPYVKSGVTYEDENGNTKTNNTVLVGGLGKGGRGYYALNLTSTNAITEDIVMWEYPKTGDVDKDMGFSFSEAYIVKTRLTNYEWVVIFSNGYGSENGQSALYVLDMNGNVIRKIETNAYGDNGLSSPALVDVNNDQKVDYAYAGDLKGNMWKFDLTSTVVSDWAVAYHDGTNPKPLFATAPANQEITSKPDVMKHGSQNGYMVIFGTGKFLNEDDKDDKSLQTVYGIWDYGDDDMDGEYLDGLDHVTGGLTYPASNKSLLKQTVYDTASAEDGSDWFRSFTDHKIDWDDHLGWFYDIPNTPDLVDVNSPVNLLYGERVVEDVKIDAGRVIVLGFAPDDSSCSGGGNTMIYIIDAYDGSRLPVAQFSKTNLKQFDDGDGGLTAKDMMVKNGNPLDITAPTGRLNRGTGILKSGVDDLYSTSNGKVYMEKKPPGPLGISSWITR